MRIKYIGTADVRTISQEEWSAIGVKSEASRWDSENGFAQELNDQAAEWLLSHDARNFVQEEPEKKAKTE